MEINDDTVQFTALVLDVRDGLKMDYNDSLADKFGAIRGLKMST